MGLMAGLGVLGCRDFGRAAAPKNCSVGRKLGWLEEFRPVPVLKNSV